MTSRGRRGDRFFSFSFARFAAFFPFLGFAMRQLSVLSSPAPGGRRLVLCYFLVLSDARQLERLLAKQARLLLGEIASPIIRRDHTYIVPRSS